MSAGAGAARPLVAVLGVLLVVRGMRWLRPAAISAPSGRGRRDVGARLLGATAGRVAPLAVRFGPLARARSGDDLRRRLAVVGPRSRVARAVAVGVGRSTLGAWHPPSIDPQGVVMAGIRGIGVAGAGTLAVAMLLVAGPSAAIAAAGLITAAAVAPDLALARAAARDEASIEADLPAALDLLAAGAAAGRGLETMLVTAAALSDAPLAALLMRAARRQSAGQGAAEALRIEAERTAIPRLITVSAAVERAHRLGHALEPALVDAADAARFDAHATALRRAARRAPLASLVTAAVVAPACVVGLGVLVGAALLAGRPA